MRILFLDDDHGRHVHFAAANRDHYLCRVYNYDEFVAALDESETFDQIWLDHDLAWTPDGKLDPKEKTGLDAANYLANSDKLPGTVVIHSWNPVGAVRMHAALRDLGSTIIIQPFSPVY